MAEAQLDKTVRSPREQAHRFCRRVEVLATAAALPGEDIDMKAMRSFVKGYNCLITEPKLWGALERSDCTRRGCTLSRLVSIAEKCEVRYKLKRDDPVADRQPKMHMSPDNDRPQKTHAVFPENCSANGDNSWTKSAVERRSTTRHHIGPPSRGRRQVGSGHRRFDTSHRRHVSSDSCDYMEWVEYHSRTPCE
jgi:hypothetical protein